VPPFIARAESRSDDAHASRRIQTSQLSIHVSALVTVLRHAESGRRYAAWPRLQQERRAQTSKVTRGSSSRRRPTRRAPLPRKGAFTPRIARGPSVRWESRRTSVTIFVFALDHANASANSCRVRGLPARKRDDRHPRRQELYPANSASTLDDRVHGPSAARMSARDVSQIATLTLPAHSLVLAPCVSAAANTAARSGKARPRCA